MVIAIGSDHAGVDLKAEIIQHLFNSKLYDVNVDDLGPNGWTSVDYPEYAKKVATAVLLGDANFGILICGTGVGMTMAANRFSGIRAANIYDIEIAKLTRMHNDSNVLCLGARFIELKKAFDIVDAWLTTSFEGGRHQRRIDAMDYLEG